MLTREQFEAAAAHAVERIDAPELGERREGKVRDMWVVGDPEPSSSEGSSARRRVLVTTDRVSAFDRVLGTIPFKGQVLNQLSAWWFEQVADLVANHVESIPDPNVTIGYEAETLPVEVIVRGYITGVTSTALWTLYQQGIERPYGLDLPAGLQKDDPLPTPVITPTTKATGGAHDERITPAEVVERGLVPAPLWREVERVALELFRRGQEVARKAGLVLVDTKYEFGLVEGRLALIDEVHTPDSSRYWVAESYERTRGTGESPEQYDKEVLRKWFVARGYRGEGTAPAMPLEFRAEMAERYVSAYERLTGRTFEPGAQPATERIREALVAWHRAARG